MRDWSDRRRLLLLASLLALEALGRATAPSGAGLDWDGLLRGADLLVLGAACAAWGPGGLRWAPGGIRAAGIHAGLAILLLGIPGLLLLGLPRWHPHSFLWWGVFVLLGPLAEELVFRGLLLDLLKSRTGAPAAVALSAGFFAALHGWTPLPVLPLACGVVCGTLAAGRGGLLAAWAVHVAGNAYLGMRPG